MTQERLTDQIEVTLSLIDIQRVVKDAGVRQIIEQCALTGEQLGACVEDRLLERLVQLFSEAEPPLIPIPLADWVVAGPADGCRPCALPITIGWYRDALKERGYGDVAEQLEKAATHEDPLTTAKRMDTIKATVRPEVRRHLIDLDAAVQANSP